MSIEWTVVAAAIGTMALAAEAALQMAAAELRGDAPPRPRPVAFETFDHGTGAWQDARHRIDAATGGHVVPDAGGRIWRPMPVAGTHVQIAFDVVADDPPAAVTVYLDRRPVRSLPVDAGADGAPQVMGYLAVPRGTARLGLEAPGASAWGVDNFRVSTHR